MIFQFYMLELLIFTIQGDFLVGYYQRLKDLKEDADLTQKQVADLIGVSTNHYGRYERGDTDIPLEKAIILSEYYKVSLDYLAGKTNIKKPVSSKSQLTKMAEIFKNLTPENRSRIEERMLEMLDRQNK